MKKILWILFFIIVLLIGIKLFIKPDNIKIDKIKNIPNGTWQAIVKFPDWKGYVDDNLPMNSMYSFDGYKDQGKLYLNVSKEVESFDLFVNNMKINTYDIKNGIFELDISKITINGTNTLLVSNIYPNDIKEAIEINIPYPTVIDGKLNDVGLRKETFDLISNIINEDINNGFTSSQLAVIKDGKLVYNNSWGLVNSYNKDGSRIKNGIKVSNDTLYDLASNTKMYSVVYGIQYLIDNSKISLDDKIVDIIGKSFVDNTLDIKYASYKDNYPGLKKIKEWKSNITIKNVLMHQAGFPDSGHYHNEYFDIVNQKLDNKVKNILYIDDANKEKTLLEGINRTPLIYEPKSKTLYSDIDYMLLGLIIEKISGKDLNTFLKEIYWEPMGLKHITYNPLENGFNEDSCAATELNGNTRDGLIDFPRVRKDTIKCEVHDEEAYYMMEGMSGHAGLFASASDLAKLAFVMLSGGYGNNKYFSKNTRDLFISPKSDNSINYGIGWWREADDRRVWYFGTQSPENTIGHQGWTGTLTMIDYENNMVIVYLTNSINTPIVNNKDISYANDFNGRYYVSASLGFIPQLIYMGLNNQNDLNDEIVSLVKNMAIEKQRDINNIKESGTVFDKNHAIYKAKKSLEELAKKYEANN